MSNYSNHSIPRGQIKIELDYLTLKGHLEVQENLKRDLYNVNSKHASYERKVSMFSRQLRNVTNKFSDLTDHIPTNKDEKIKALTGIIADFIAIEKEFAVFADELPF